VSVRLNHEALGTTTNERKGTLYSIAFLFAASFLYRIRPYVIRQMSREPLLVNLFDLELLIAGDARPELSMPFDFLFSPIDDTPSSLYL